MATTSERLRCCLPFCGRTIRAGKYNEWICQKHWQPVAREIKGEYRKAKSAFRRERCEATGTAANQVWERCKRAAVEAAAFI